MHDGLVKRRMPVGAELLADDTVSFRIWAPKRRRVRVTLEGGSAGSVHELQPDENGYFSGRARGLKAGGLYRYLLDDEPMPYPDPASRFQPDGPHGPSEVIEPHAYAWTDDAWPGVKRDGHVLYEMHVGTFTREGTFLAACERLGDLADLGVTLLEIMPVADFPGRFGWGYDGVDLFAPSHLYGRPDDLRMLVDQAHAHGIGVILDWVPSHFPTDAHGLGYFDGTHLYEHADPRQGFHPEWNTYIFNYSRNEVRSFLISSALFWLDKYHIDGLRVDAVASMLYLDYSRKEGEWVPNRYGGRENLDAIDFLRLLNSLTHDRFPGTVTIAEESTAFPAVSRPT